MDRFPDSLIAFQRMFPHDDACAAWLASVRWPEGFECPRCGHDHGWALRGKAHTFECARCHRQTSVTAGTILHGSKLALTVWFWAAYLMATHSNGIAALQLQNQLGIGSYRSAWLLAAKLRKAMVDPERDPLSGLIEVDETALAFRTKNDPVAGGAGRSHDGKLLVVGAVEVGDGNDIGSMAAHLVLPWIHQVFSNLKGWARGVYHGLINRRRTRHAAFRSLFGIAVCTKPFTYKCWSGRKHRRRISDSSG